MLQSTTDKILGDSQIATEVWEDNSYIAKTQLCRHSNYSLLSGGEPLLNLKDWRKQSAWQTGKNRRYSTGKTLLNGKETPRPSTYDNSWILQELKEKNKRSEATILLLLSKSLSIKVNSQHVYDSQCLQTCKKQGILSLLNPDPWRILPVLLHATTYNCRIENPTKTPKHWILYLLCESTSL
jgi:hypothetical protein